MHPLIRIPLLAALAFAAAGPLAAQSTRLSPSPTLPSDTLEANFAPRSEAGPAPDVSPTLPSDTLEATQPVDSFPTDPFLQDSISDDSVSGDSVSPRAGLRLLDPDASAADSAALEEVRAWIEHHPFVSPPPVRAILVKV